MPPRHPCPPAEQFNVPTWGTDESFSVQMAYARKGLFTEVDRLDRAVATQLAQRYILFWLGAEARQILELDPTLSQANAPLLLIADILDGFDPDGETALWRNPDCAPEVVLWTTLAQPDPVQGCQT